LTEGVREILVVPFGDILFAGGKPARGFDRVAAALSRARFRLVSRSRRLRRRRTSSDTDTCSRAARPRSISTCCSLSWTCIRTIVYAIIQPRLMA